MPKKHRKHHKGSLSDLSLGVVIALVSLFIGLYMITKVADVTAINSDSDFYSVYTNLTTNTGTIFDVIILVIIVVSLGVAIAVLRGFGATSPSERSASTI
jgi:hypothetical protein